VLDQGIDPPGVLALPGLGGFLTQCDQYAVAFFGP
jgi:hypothetical protein